MKLLAFLSALLYTQVAATKNVVDGELLNTEDEGWYDRMLATEIFSMPSAAPSNCAEVIDLCPYDTCFLPYNDGSRPPNCNAIGRPDCNVMPTPPGLNCPRCCTFECRPDNQCSILLLTEVHLSALLHLCQVQHLRLVPKSLNFAPTTLAFCHIMMHPVHQAVTQSEDLNVMSCQHHLG